MAKDKGGGKFRERKVNDMPEGKPFLVADEGYFVWVRPSVIDGRPNERGPRVLCRAAMERNNGNGPRLCAVRIADQQVVADLLWQNGIVMSQLAEAFGLPKHPDVYIEEAYDDELQRSVRVTRYLERKKKEKGAEAPAIIGAGHL